MTSPHRQRGCLLAVTLVGAAPPSPEFSAKKFRAHVGGKTTSSRGGRNKNSRNTNGGPAMHRQPVRIARRGSQRAPTALVREGRLRRGRSAANPRDEGSGKTQKSVKATRRADGRIRWTAAPSMCERGSYSRLRHDGHGPCAVDDYAGRRLDVKGKDESHGGPRGDSRTEWTVRWRAPAERSGRYRGGTRRVGVIRIAVTIPGRPSSTLAVTRSRHGYRRMGLRRSGGSPRGAAILEQAAAETLFDGLSTRLSQFSTQPAKARGPQPSRDENQRQARRDDDYPQVLE